MWRKIQLLLNLNWTCVEKIRSWYLHISRRTTNKNYNKTCAISKDSDQPAHARRMIIIFADRMCLLQPLGYPKRNTKEPLPYRLAVQADMSLWWSHRSYSLFYHAMAYLGCTVICGMKTFNKKVRESPGSATITNRIPSQTPRGRGNRQIQTSTNQTNVRKALGLALSSPSEVIAVLKGLKNTRTKWHKAILKNRLVE